MSSTGGTGTAALNANGNTVPTSPGAKTSKDAASPDVSSPSTTRSLLSRLFSRSSVVHVSCIDAYRFVGVLGTGAQGVILLSTTRSAENEPNSVFAGADASYGEHLSAAGVEFLTRNGRMGSSRKVSMASAGSLTSSSESVGVDDAPTLRSCSPPLRQSGSLELYQQALLQHHLQQCSQTQPVYVAIKRVQLAMPPGSYSSENNTNGGDAGGGKPAPASPLRKRVSGMTSIVAPSGANDQAAALQLYTSEASSAINMREINTRLMPKEASKEILAMKLLNHPNIVRLYDVFLAGNDGKMYLVTEFVSGGNLASTMKDNKLPRSGVKREVFTRMMIVSITSALDYMHSQNLAHRDLKPANVLVGPPVKLCDLGFSNDGSQLVTRLGTAEYMAPEIVLADGRTPYNVKIDCWSLGVITYELISKHCDRPFVGRSYSALAQAILRNDVNYDLLSVGAYTVSSDCIDFIRCLLCESDKRMSAAEALMHPWLSERRLSVMSISDESAVTMENLSRSGDNVVSEGRGTSGSNSNGKSFGSRSKKNNKSGLRTITEE